MLSKWQRTLAGFLPLAPSGDVGIRYLSLVMRNVWIGDSASPDIFKEAGTGPSRRRTVTATVHGVARLASYRATLFLCAYNTTAIPSSAATTVKQTSAERIENWGRKRRTPTPARAKERAGYQRGKKTPVRVRPNALC